MSLVKETWREEALPRIPQLNAGALVIGLVQGQHGCNFVTSDWNLKESGMDLLTV